MKVGKFKKSIMVLSIFFPSKIRVITFRMLGFKIGKRVTISPMTILIANDIRLDDFAEIKPFSLINIDKLQMGKYSIIASLSAVFGNNGLIMADRSRVGHANILDCTANIYLGHYCGLGPTNILYTHASWLPLTMGYPNYQKEIRLGNYIWTGISNIILPGTKTQDNIFTSACVVMKGEVKGDSFLTSDGPLPIEKVLRMMTIEQVIEKQIKEISKDIKIFCNSSDVSVSSMKECKVCIITKIDEGIINSAFKNRKPVIYFSKKLDETEISKLNQMRVDWYDFDSITMSSFYHKYKIPIMKILVTFGGLRFLENKSSISS